MLQRSDGGLRCAHPPYALLSIAGRNDRGGLDHEDHAAFGRARAVSHAFRHDEALTGKELDRALFEIDDEASAEHEEELVVVIMLVPMILALQDAEPDHGIVHPA